MSERGGVGIKNKAARCKDSEHDVSIALRQIVDDQALPRSNGDRCSQLSNEPCVLCGQHAILEARAEIDAAGRSVFG